VLSPGFKSKLQALGVPSDKLHVIYNWTDESVFGVADRDTSALPAFGIPDPFTILYAGNLGRYQGLDTAIRAAARLRNDLPRMRLVLMGDGVATLELRALAERLDATNVFFAGRHPHNEMGATMQRASVLLVSLKDLPFFAWTIPSKTQAAMASGRPVLMSVRGDAANLIRTAGAGVCCTPGDEDQMVATMRSLYELTPGELDAMGRQAQQFYRSRLSLERGVSQLEALMIAAVASRTPHCDTFGGRTLRSPLRGSRRSGGDTLR
jgi:glycosyltransferase involved in cell wall biosynthesis